VIEALAFNTKIQVLYFQGYGVGMRAPQLAKLTQVLERPDCGVWAMNIGESPRVSDEAWWTFCDRLPHTKLGALFAEPNHLPNGVKPKMIEALRSNRIRDQLHNLQEHPENEHEVKNADKMWWHLACANCNVEYFHCQKLAHLGFPDKVEWADFPPKPLTTKIRAKWGGKAPPKKRQRTKPPCDGIVVTPNGGTKVGTVEPTLHAISTPIQTMPCEFHATQAARAKAKAKSKKQLAKEFQIEMCAVVVDTPVKTPQKTNSGRKVRKSVKLKDNM